MSQSRRASLIEAIGSTAIGFLYAMTLGHFLYIFFDYPVTVADNFWMTLIFTVASFLRSYLVRRLFELLNTKGILR